MKLVQVMLKLKPGHHQSQKYSSSGNHEYLYQLPWQSIKQSSYQDFPLKSKCVNFMVVLEIKSEDHQSQQSFILWTLWINIHNINITTTLLCSTNTIDNFMVLCSIDIWVWMTNWETKRLMLPYSHKESLTKTETWDKRQDGIKSVSDSSSSIKKNLKFKDTQDNSTGQANCFCHLFPPPFFSGIISKHLSREAGSVMAL